MFIESIVSTPLVSSSPPLCTLHCSQYNMRLVDGDLSDQMSGFEHNAVTPLGCKTSFPVILQSDIARLPIGQFWLGGGEVDLKLRFPVDEFKRAFHPHIGDVAG
mmetsp:Transcript_4310/g.10748  ORF Transcript_4310/g.10748 Transcript_4310/m.10748 type:complete len:104 (+) Transcript_4310:60-371(+)